MTAREREFVEAGASCGLSEAESLDVYSEMIDDAEREISVTAFLSVDDPVD